MVARKHGGLGKGLGALIPEEKEEAKESVSKIDINLIRANEEQPRKYFDDEKIANLAQSIKEHGIIQPIILMKNGDFYTIVAGERRWRAAKSIGIKEVPAIVMEISNKQLLEISLIENIQREDLNPIEEAIAYKKLIEEFNITQEDLAAKLGKSRTAITNSMRLLNLDKRVQDYLIEGVISEGHGRAILGISDFDMQNEVAQKIIDEGLSVRQVEALIRQLNSEKKPQNKSKQKQQNPYINEIKEKLESYLGTKVQLTTNKKNKGKIEIEYYSTDDLNRILELLNIEI
ncbi:MAG: ParB/RepB/Spo0J family partition protein [Clostridiales bacterium]|uniref:ParB/RepB/Spo0J family partition protein n=1 Tax=Clostridium sp. N3C TaxID=1776758 RepID=UPI00092DFF07|nr:ParB/RepB/Spo0J family partition protein [Clostridium sp. N3C]NLZ49671.1 ParB/RepB/Spo0J family partition protein [Clostridiales bacterium]SCN25592.1 putative chromosome-partitioning protein ParB [Clostridium sp. N3C]